MNHFKTILGLPHLNLFSLTESYTFTWHTTNNWTNCHPHIRSLGTKQLGRSNCYSIILKSGANSRKSGMLSPPTRGCLLAMEWWPLDGSVHHCTECCNVHHGALKAKPLPMDFEDEYLMFVCIIWIICYLYIYIYLYMLPETDNPGKVVLAFYRHAELLAISGYKL